MSCTLKALVPQQVISPEEQTRQVSSHCMQCKHQAANTLLLGLQRYLGLDTQNRKLLIKLRFLLIITSHGVYYTISMSECTRSMGYGEVASCFEEHCRVAQDFWKQHNTVRANHAPIRSCMKSFACRFDCISVQYYPSNLAAQSSAYLTVSVRRKKKRG